MPREGRGGAQNGGRGGEGGSTERGGEEGERGGAQNGGEGGGGVRIIFANNRLRKKAISVFSCFRFFKLP